MLNNYLANIFGSDVAAAIIVALLVFTALFLILSIIWLVASLASMTRKKDSYDEDGDRPLPDVTITEDNAVIAAISAAIAVILSEEAAAKGTTYNGFKIVSFRRADKGRSWTQKNK